MNHFESAWIGKAVRKKISRGNWICDKPPDGLGAVFAYMEKNSFVITAKSRLLAIYLLQ